MRPYVEILEYIRDTRCKLEEIPQNEYGEISRGICYEHIKVVEGYLFLTPLGASIIYDFYRRKEEIEKTRKMNSEFRESFSMGEGESFSMGEGVFVRFTFMMFIIGLVLIISKSCAN